MRVAARRPARAGPPSEPMAGGFARSPALPDTCRGNSRPTSKSSGQAAIRNRSANWLIHVHLELGVRLVELGKPDRGFGPPSPLHPSIAAGDSNDRARPALASASVERSLPGAEETSIDLTGTRCPGPVVKYSKGGPRCFPPGPGRLCTRPSCPEPPRHRRRARTGPHPVADKLTRAAVGHRGTTVTSSTSIPQGSSQPVAPERPVTACARVARTSPG